jgi:hypothetical protein
MTEQRNWRDAKVPQWVKDSIAADLAAYKLTAALSWPTETKPAPLAFQWGAYDKMYGTMQEGVFWSPDGRGLRVEIRQRKDINPDDLGRNVMPHDRVLFRTEFEKFDRTPMRGPLFATRREAQLYQLWALCEGCAKTLMQMRDAMEKPE